MVSNRKREDPGNECLCVAAITLLGCCHLANFDFVVVNGYNKIPRLETKFSGATNLSQIFLDKMFPRSQSTDKD